MEYRHDADRYPLGPFTNTVNDLSPTEREMYEVLDLIVAEFDSDPMSVQCFDARTVARAKAVVEPFRKLRAISGKHRR